MTESYATREDYEANRKFCIIRVSLLDFEMKVKLVGTNFVITPDSGNNLRISMQGTIDNIVLGKLRMESASCYCYVGNIVGYSEEVDALIRSAQWQLERLREEYLEKLERHKRTLQTLDIVVEA